jgi:hypothetical protein
MSSIARFQSTSYGRYSWPTAEVATVLASFFPADSEALMLAAEETGNSRMWAGIHFQSDVDAVLALSKNVAEMVIEHIATMTPQ